VRGAILASAGAARRVAPPQRANRPARVRLRAVLGLVLTLAGLGASWFLFAPPQLGGSTSLVVVDGTSMLPHLRSSDLVVLRQSSSPRVGDVVGYRSAMLNRVVLHRITAIEGTHFVLKGDNNSFVDPDRPERSELVGELWFHVPSAGRAIAWLHVPWVLAALAALLVLAAGLSGSGARARDESEASIGRS
jgi:signal peptidase I